VIVEMRVRASAVVGLPAHDRRFKPAGARERGENPRKLWPRKLGPDSDELLDLIDKRLRT
jgi:hypothetical protein